MYTATQRPIPTKVSVVMNNFEKAQISVELSRLIARQTEFFQKSYPTPSELQEFEDTQRPCQPGTKNRAIPNIAVQCFPIEE